MTHNGSSCPSGKEGFPTANSHVLLRKHGHIALWKRCGSEREEEINSESYLHSPIRDSLSGTPIGRERFEKASQAAIAT